VVSPRVVLAVFVVGEVLIVIAVVIIVTVCAGASSVLESWVPAVEGLAHRLVSLIEYFSFLLEGFRSVLWMSFPVIIGWSRSWILLSGAIFWSRPPFLTLMVRFRTWTTALFLSTSFLAWTLLPRAWLETVPLLYSSHTSVVHHCVIVIIISVRLASFRHVAVSVVFVVSIS
jgi:hypothetical protein